MTNPLKWTADRILNFWDKLTKENTSEIDKFLGGFHRLCVGEIQYVLDLINEEVRKSSKFELFIKEEDVLKEKVAILSILNQLGGIIKIREDFLPRNDTLFNFFSKCLFRALEPQISYYFGQTPPGQVKNRYNCHLTTVIGRLGNDILNDNIPMK